MTYKSYKTYKPQSALPPFQQHDILHMLGVGEHIDGLDAVWLLLFINGATGGETVQVFETIVQASSDYRPLCFLHRLSTCPHGAYWGEKWSRFRRNIAFLMLTTKYRMLTNNYEYLCKTK